MTSRNMFPALLVGALFSGTADGEEGVVKATLAEVSKTPLAYLQTHFEFVGRFDALGEIYQPFFTIFDEYRYANFSAWDHTQNLASRAEYLNSFALLYMPRNKLDPIENTFGLLKFQRFKAIGKVQSVFGDKPFVEIIDLVPLDTELCDKDHLQNAMRPVNVAAELAAADAAKMSQMAEEQDEVLPGAMLAADKAIKDDATEAEGAAEENAEAHAGSTQSETSEKTPEHN